MKNIFDLNDPNSSRLSISFLPPPPPPPPPHSSFFKLSQPSKSANWQHLVTTCTKALSLGYLHYEKKIHPCYSHASYRVLYTGVWESLSEKIWNNLKCLKRCAFQCITSLKAMDSFGTWRKWFFFFFVNAEIYRVVWTINALLTVCSEMLHFQEITKTWKCLESPEHFAIGYVFAIGTICHSKQFQEGLMVFSDDFLHFLKIKKKIVEFTKTILWLENWVLWRAKICEIRLKYELSHPCTVLFHHFPV